MKYKKILHILVVGILLSLMLVTIPASQVFAAERIDLDPEEGEVLDYIDIDGRGFEPSVESPSFDSRVDIYFSVDEADEGDDIDNEVEDYELVKSLTVDEDGDFSSRFRIPKTLTDGDTDRDVKGGTYYVYVTEEDDETILAMAEITVLSAEIELDTDEGTVGTEVEITGVDFADSEDITVEFGGDDVDIESGDDSTDNSGEFVCTIIVPEASNGEQTITVTDESNNEAEATFTVEADITVTPEEAAPGDSMTVSGTGFAASEGVTIDFDGSEVKTGNTNSDGSFSLTFNVPAKSAGDYDIFVEDDDGNEAEGEFSIGSIMQISKTSGNVGDTFTVSGSGFAPNSAISIVFITETTTSSVNANGEFSSTVTVPPGKSGPQLITVSGGGTTLTMSFNIDSIPPQSPQPLLPANGEKVDSLVSFDWRDVTDPSTPVTYTLQISTDTGFASTLLEKKGLTRSEYTLSEGEKLVPGTDGAPYYWRVQSVDAAGNGSAWTGRGAFYVNYGLGMLPPCVKYLLIGIGGVVLFLVGFMLGKK